MMFAPVHWMTARMANPDRAVAITSPSGDLWMLGDEVLVMPSPFEGERVHRSTPFTSILTAIFPGSWDARAKDVDSVWLYFENGWGARPWLCRRLR